MSSGNLYLIRIALVFSLQVIGCSSVFAAPVVLNICYEETEVFPNFMGEGGNVKSPDPGVVIELIQLMDKDLEDVDVDFHRAAWVRCLNGLRTGVYNGVVGGYETERAEYAIFPTSNGLVDKSLAVSQTEFCLFSKKGSPLSWQNEKFIGGESTSLAIPRGYSLISLLDEHNILYELTFSSRLAIDLLMGGRVENAITLCTTGQASIDKSSNNLSLEIPTVLRRQYAYLMVNQSFFAKHQITVKRVWRSLAKHREQSFDSLTERYLQSAN